MKQDCHRDTEESEIMHIKYDPSRITHGCSQFLLYIGESRVHVTGNEHMVNTRLLGQRLDVLGDLLMGLQAQVAGDGGTRNLLHTLARLHEGTHTHSTLTCFLL